MDLHDEKVDDPALVEEEDEVEDEEHEVGSKRKALVELLRPREARRHPPAVYQQAPDAARRANLMGAMILIAEARQERAQRLPANEWRADCPRYQDEDGEWCKWVYEGGVSKRYRLTHELRDRDVQVLRHRIRVGRRIQAQVEVWVDYPLVNTNIFPREALHVIFTKTPLLYALTTCNLVCKDWNRAFGDLPQEYWAERGHLEWGISKETLRIPKPIFSPLTYIRREAAAVTLLISAITEDWTLGDIPSVSRLIYKGFPLPCLRRGLEVALDQYMESIESPREGMGPKEHVALRVAYNLGPLGRGEVMSPTSNGGLDNGFSLRTNIRSDKVTSLTWAAYINKLLELVKFEALGNELRVVGSSRHIEEWKDIGNFITQLGLHLRDKYSARVVLSNRVSMHYDGFEERHYRKLIKAKEKARKTCERISRQLTENLQEPTPASMPEPRSTIYTFAIGHCIDLDVMSTQSNYPIRFKGRDPRSLIVRADFGAFRLNVVFFGNGNIVVADAADPAHMEIAYEWITTFADRFRVVPAVPEVENVGVEQMDLNIQ